MSTRIAVIGANGKVATCLIHQLSKLTDEFVTTAFIRNAQQIPKFEQLGLFTSLEIDLTNSSVSDIARALKGFDAVVFSAGAAGKGLDLTLSVDLDGAVKVSEALQINGIKRFILVSALKSQEREFWWDTQLRSYYIAKKYADDIISSKLDIDWTILQPGMLEDTEGTGLIEDPTKVNDMAHKCAENGVLKISRIDVASTIVECLQNPGTIHKFIPLINGGLQIKNAIKTISF
ncbi:hypothetical protein WICPIJ_009109 [Wickerhamomyces pijperi]|uniref:NAD(P)-binding domain-containing protein n=1 Tax=Wickerhamomyces pijperi TaxID=599730 RepID=A0A9P8PQB1_WICPI|nr:hypothetical protein WICPIJ_009109 [Wickerhamomyces pijperi]